MTKTIEIDGKAVAFKASAAVPRLYRLKTGRDVMRDMAAVGEAIKGGDQMPVQMLQVFEDMAYVMARHADPDGVPDTAEDWLEQFETFSIYEVFPEIAELWATNMQTLETPKKK